MGMETSHDAQTQPNTEGNVQERIIVELTDPPESGISGGSIPESGLLRISDIKRLRREDKKLREKFRSWMPMPPQLNEQWNEQGQQVQTKSVQFNDAADCIDYVKTCGRQCVVLVLSGSHAQNETLVSEFKRFLQVAMIYHRVPQNPFQQWSKCWSFDSLFSGQNRLLRRIMGTPSQKLDEASQLQLVQILFNEFIVNLPRAEEAKKDFIDFCRTTYENDPTYLTQIDDFEKYYREEDSVMWYTKNGFLLQIVGKTCSAFSFNNFFKIRFILRDIYMQLQKLHDEQSTRWPKSFFVVYQGIRIPREELNRLPKKGEYFATKGFLSTTTDHEVADMFSGASWGSKDSVSVIITMYIDREEVASKPIAFISEHSMYPDEGEVMLPMGIVFRTESYEKSDNDDSPCVVRITMICSKKEQQIKKECSQFLGLTRTTVVASFMATNMLMESEKDSKYYEEYCKLLPNAAETIDPAIADPLEDEGVGG